jgi:hypothetical protein
VIREVARIGWVACRRNEVQANAAAPTVKLRAPSRSQTSTTADVASACGCPHIPDSRPEFYPAEALLSAAGGKLCAMVARIALLCRL